MFSGFQKKRWALSVLSIVLLVTFMVFGIVTTLFLDATSVLASGDVASTTSMSTSSSISSSDSSSEPINQNSDLIIVSYTTRVNEQIVTQITPGMIFTLEVRIHDPRITSQTNPLNLEVLPRGKMNTSSFTPTNPAAVAAGRNGSYASTPDGGYDYIMDFDMVYSGNGNTFQADVYYEGPLGDVAPLKSINLTLNNSVPTPPSSSSEPIISSSQVVRGTGFALKDASYGDSGIYAGQEFTLSMTMLATNGASNIENVSATIVPDQHFSLASGASTIYFGTASPNQNIPLEFHLNAAANAEDGSYKITVNLTGVSSLTGEAVQASVDISVPVQQPDRFVLNNFAPIDYISAGPGDGSGYMSIELINMGKSIVSNVIVSVDSEGVYTEEGQVYVGNFAAGAKNGVDLTLLSDTPGTYDVTLVISYENARGEVNEIREPFQMDVGEAMMDDSFFFEVPIEEETSTPAWLILLLVLGVVLVGGILAFIVIKKRHKTKKDAELEDDDDEDL